MASHEPVLGQRINDRRGSMTQTARAGIAPAIALGALLLCSACSPTDVTAPSAGGPSFGTTGNPTVGTITNLGSFGGATSLARGVNSQGVAAGVSDLPNGTYHAFVWSAANGLETSARFRAITAVRHSPSTTMGRSLARAIRQLPDRARPALRRSGNRTDPAVTRCNRSACRTSPPPSTSTTAAPWSAPTPTLLAMISRMPGRLPPAGRRCHFLAAST